MDDWYKKYIRSINSLMQSIHSSKIFDDIYHNTSKYFLDHEELISRTIAPIDSSYGRLNSSLQPTIEKMRSSQLSSTALESMYKSNTALNTFLADQSSFSKLIEEATPINRHWLEAIEAAKLLTTVTNPAHLALRKHLDDIARTTLLAQQHLLSLPWEEFEKNILAKPYLSAALNSFTQFTQSYESLIQSFNNESINIVDFPPFVTSLPPVEILTCSDLLYSFSTEIYVEEADAFEIEIREDIETSLDELLDHINPGLKKLLQGAKDSIFSKNPDKKRHIATSLRELISHILHAVAPDNEVSKWSSKPDYFHEGRPTRKARLLYVCRDINHGPFEQFVNKNVESHLKLINLFQQGTHEIDVNFTEKQLLPILIETEALARFLLIIWKNSKH